MAKSSILFLNDNASGLIAADARKMLLKAGFSESDIDLFTETLTGLLDDYAAAFGEKSKVQYTIWKTLILCGPDHYLPAADGQFRRRVQRFLHDDGRG